MLSVVTLYHSLLSIEDLVLGRIIPTWVRYIGKPSIRTLQYQG